MYKYKRFILNLNENKIKEKYNLKLKKLCDNCSNLCKSENIESNINCIKRKWDIQRTDWEQNFDSDCFAHCCQYDICSEIFQDTECHNEGHMNSIIVEFEEKLPGFEEPLI